MSLKSIDKSSRTNLAEDLLSDVADFQRRSGTFQRRFGECEEGRATGEVLQGGARLLRQVEAVDGRYARVGEGVGQAFDLNSKSITWL